MKPSIAWVLLALTLTACGQQPVKPSLPLTEPTPAVNCGEHDPSEVLPALPEVPDALTVFPGDYAAAAAQLGIAKQYIDDLDKWAIKSAGVAQRNNLKRQYTASCLNGYRRRGVIR